MGPGRTSRAWYFHSSAFSRANFEFLCSLSDLTICEVVQSYLTCVEKSLEEPDVPSVMRQSVGHIVAVMRAPITAVCQHNGKDT